MRRLLPVLALVLVLGLVLTGVIRRPGSLPTSAGPGHRAASPAPAAAASQSVGPIPGASAAASAGGAVAARPFSNSATLIVAPLHGLDQADLLALSPATLPAGTLAQITKLPGVVAATAVDAGRLKVNGVLVNVLGVDPSAFRPFAAGPTASLDALWQNVAAGGIAISYTMSQQDNLSLDQPVKVEGATTVQLPVAGFGTVGVGGVDAVVSRSVAASLGIQPGDAIVISAPQARLASLMTTIKNLLPAQSSVVPLVSQVEAGSAVVTVGSAGGYGLTSQNGLGLTAPQTAAFLAAAETRIGALYVWGGSGPGVFDCSGLVQWSMAQAGIVMPRVAADQARTGPLVATNALQPGDLLFYHTDPTAPNYISHVAIYLGNGQMLQAPHAGAFVEIVPAYFGAGFAGAVRVYPAVAAAAAAHPLF